MMTEAQIAHLEQHEQQFRRAIHPDGVRTYAVDYAHIPDQYERACADLGLTPKERS